MEKGGSYIKERGKEYEKGGIKELFLFHLLCIICLNNPLIFFFFFVVVVFFFFVVVVVVGEGR